MREEDGSHPALQRGAAPGLPALRRPLEEAFSAPAIQFKGSGWYITDYARAKQESGKSAKDSEGGEKAAEKSATSPEKAAKSGDTEKHAKSEKHEKAAAKTDKKKT